MTRTLTYNLVKKIMLLLIAGFFLSFVQATYAQDATGSGHESTSSAQNIKKFKITFPIAQLGNCADLAACKAYCDDEANKEACLTYAEGKGIGKNKKKLNTLTRSVMLEARTLLGCSTDTECKDFCKLKENKEKCSEFAKTYNLKGGHKLKIGTESGKFKGLKDATGSGEKFTPNSQRAFEHANANARFCRENPGKCTKEGSASAELEERKLKQKLEGEIKELKIKEEKIEKEEKKLKNLERKESKNSDVQGISSSPSVFEKITRFLFR